MQSQPCGLLDLRAGAYGTPPPPGRDGAGVAGGAFALLYVKMQPPLTSFTDEQSTWTTKPGFSTLASAP